MDCSPLGFSIHGVLQARILEWVVISYSVGPFQPRIKPMSVESPAWAGEFTSKPWEAPQRDYICTVTQRVSARAEWNPGLCDGNSSPWPHTMGYTFLFFLAIKCPHYSLEWGQSEPGVSPSEVSSVSLLPKEKSRFQKFRKLLSDLSEDHLFKGILERVSNNVLPFKISSPQPQCLADSNYRDLTVLEIFRFFYLKTHFL